MGIRLGSLLRNLKNHMKNTYLGIVSAAAIALIAFNAPTYGQAGTTGAVVAKEITKEDAAKKYPPGPKGYLPGIKEYSRSATANAGFFRSPYSSKMYDCRSLKPGMFVLDSYARPPQVFVVPQ